MTKTNPLLTVYLVNYNYGKYLEQSIESVLAQTLTDFELIIIDDGSTDQSRDILKKYEGTEGLYIIFQKNQGLTKTNNIALNMARGKYIARLDADDYFAPEALEKMVELLNDSPQTALVFPDYYHVDEQGNVINQYQRFDFSSKELLLEKPAHGAVTMIRTKVLREVGGYDEEFNCQDGYNLWLKIFKNYEVKNLPEPLFYYRQHDSNLTKDQQNLLQTRAKMMQKFADENQLAEIKTCAVIPVRGSGLDPRSQPQAQLAGKGLIEWTIDAALASQKVDHVLVTTPDKGLMEFVQEKYGDQVLVHLRDITYARINTDISQTLKGVNQYLQNQEIHCDALLTLYVEYPFRSASYIDKAVNHMRIYEVEAVDAVKQDNGLFYHHDGSGLKLINQDSFLRLERDEIFRRSGGIHLIRCSSLRDQEDIWQLKTGHIIVDEWANFRVSDQFNLDIANHLAEKFLAKQGEV